MRVNVTDVKVSSLLISISIAKKYLVCNKISKWDVNSNMNSSGCKFNLIKFEYGLEGGGKLGKYLYRILWTFSLGNC